MSELRFPQINQVAVSGRLTHDPEFRITKTGKALVNFSVALNQNYQDKSGKWQQETTFIPVVAWDKTAEYIEQRLHKGGSVFITGRLKSRTYKTRDGNRTVVELLVRHVQLLDKKGGLESEKNQE
jgi:single-strand DNA-binding protein